MRTKKGFTLVEIMIVVAIIGVLAAIAIPSFSKARETTRKNACINNLRLIDSAKEQWAMAENKQDDHEVTETDEAAIVTYLRGGSLPDCPANGNYTINNIGADPTCDITDHVLP